ncbi:DUF1479-domain-containing protein [Xylaria palmicola]|nr:DUF1479-domain-containing protein [Xylaria palmicola]
MLVTEPTHYLSPRQHPLHETSDMATNGIGSMPDSESIPLSARFAKLKRNMIACREKDVAESFYRLLRALRKEADDIAVRGSDVIPTIDYFDIHDGAKASAFRKALRRRGVAVIKRVVPHSVAQTWKEETIDYVADNPQARGHPPHDPRLFDLYWSPSQVHARVDSRLLDAQRFAMATWHASDEHALVSAEHPVVYADRLRVGLPDDASHPGSAHVDNGSVERWEPDGYGASGTYRSVFSGRWEDYDPWDSSPRLHITTDLYNRTGSCSMFRMFQGFLSLSSIPAGSGALSVCPMLQLSTAYLLLRPFFTPRHKNPAAAEPDFLHPGNWNLNVSQTSVLHGAVPGYQQDVSGALHPHLQLRRTMVSVPDLEPGDYVIWHPDLVHAVDVPSSPKVASPDAAAPAITAPYSPSPFSLYASATYPFRPSPNPIPNPASPSSSSRSASLSSFAFSTTSSPPPLSSPPRYHTHTHAHAYSHSYGHAHSHAHAAARRRPQPHPRDPDATLLYVPACPLTQTNALYLARQRRAFLLGLAAPDFASAGSASAGERDYAGRSGVQDVADAGGEDGLRGMGLTPWEERDHHHHYHHHNQHSQHQQGRRPGDRDRDRDKDARLLRLANGILFPDRFDGVLKRGGRR